MTDGVRTDGDEGIVHVHGGSALLDRLEEAGVPGARLSWCDPVSDGPTPAGLDPGDGWYRVRAAHLAAGQGAPDAASIEAGLRAEDLALAAIPAGTEVVLWAGPELFCQAILMRLESDLFDLLNAVVDEKLDTVDIRWDPRPAVSVVMSA